MTDEKSNSLMADLNTDLNEPASPDDVNEVNSRKAGCTEPEQKTDQSAKIDLPDPDVTRLFKNRARDGDIIKKCKIMLVAGVPPGKVALLLRLPLERVIELYNSSYNPRCRRFANPNNGRLIITMWHEGAMLADICQALCEPEQREIDNNDVARGRDARRYLSGAWLALIYRGDVPPG